MDHFFKRILLTVASVLSILVLMNLKYTKEFFKQRVVAYWGFFSEEKNLDVSLKDRKLQRYGAPYNVCMIVKDYLEKNNIKDPIILFEPNDYLLETIKFKMPEPIIIYYYTGLKSLWTNSSDVKTATYMVYLKPDGVNIQPIQSQEQLQTILNKYKKYTPSL